MLGYYYIMVYSHDGKRLLFVRSDEKENQGLLTLVTETYVEGAEGLDISYRRLQEVTGYDSSMIDLHRIMDVKYYNQEIYIEVYAGRLKEGNIQPIDSHLEWRFMNENFYNRDVFAGEGRIGHLVDHIKKFGISK